VADQNSAHLARFKLLKTFLTRGGSCNRPGAAVSVAADAALLLTQMAWNRALGFDSQPKGWTFRRWR